MLLPLLRCCCWLGCATQPALAGRGGQQIGGPALVPVAAASPNPHTSCALLTSTHYPHSLPAQVLAFAAFYSGAAVMALIGRWL